MVVGGFLAGLAGSGAEVGCIPVNEHCELDVAPSPPDGTYVLAVQHLACTVQSTPTQVDDIQLPNLSIVVSGGGKEMVVSFTEPDGLAYVLDYRSP